MKTIYPLKQVFVAGGQPTLTYVDRDHLNLERDLKRALNKGYSVIALTGSTKSGKTVLCRKVIKDDDSVWIEGGQVNSLDAITSHIAFKLNIPESVTRDGKDEIAGAVRGFGVEAGKKAISSQTLSWSGPSLLKAYESLRRHNKTLIIDDFHYIAPEIQQEFVRSIKSEVFNGLSVVLISVPHRAFDVVRVETEMQGRFSHIKVEPWSNDDLESIIDLGGNALNANFSKAFRAFSVAECFENPLIMQSICSEQCAEIDLLETSEDEITVQFSEAVGQSIMKKIAKDAGYPTFRRLQAGPQIRKKRSLHEFNDADSGDIYKSVLYAISKSGPKQQITYNEIREQLQALLAGKVPQKNEITRTLVHMGKLAKEDVEGEPALDWDAEDETLYITDPFLLCFMKWLPGIDPRNLQ